MYVRVCQFSGKTNSFDFFSPNLLKNGFRVGNVGIRISIVKMPYVKVFRKKWTILTFSTQICPIMDFGVGISKSGFGICTFKIPCMSISVKMNNFDFFGPNLPKKGIRI